MITIEQLYGPWLNHPDATDECKAASAALLAKVNALLDQATAAGVELEDNPITGNQVSGVEYGGFRPQSCTQGAPHSPHKEGRGVDVHDAGNKLDAWLTDEILEAAGLYREAPHSTPGWCHLTDRAPGSGHRTFVP
jgi:hypothetical protein